MTMRRQYMLRWIAIKDYRSWEAVEIVVYFVDRTRLIRVDVPYSSTYDDDCVRWNFSRSDLIQLIMPLQAVLHLAILCNSEALVDVRCVGVEEPSLGMLQIGSLSIV